jgi:hypothetical protein
MRVLAAVIGVIGWLVIAASAAPKYSIAIYE